MTTTFITTIIYFCLIMVVMLTNKTKKKTRRIISTKAAVCYHDDVVTILLCLLGYTSPTSYIFLKVFKQIDVLIGWEGRVEWFVLSLFLLSLIFWFLLLVTGLLRKIPLGLFLSLLNNFTFLSQYPDPCLLILHRIYTSIK